MWGSDLVPASAETCKFLLKLLMQNVIRKWTSGLELRIIFGQALLFINLAVTRTPSFLTVMLTGNWSELN